MKITKGRIMMFLGFTSGFWTMYFGDNFKGWMAAIIPTVTALVVEEVWKGAD